MCVGTNVTIEFIEDSLLYDSTSKDAMIAGIAQSTGIPYYDVTYNKDISLLCPVIEDDVAAGFASEVDGTLGSGSRVRRFLAADSSTLNFAIRKPLLRKFCIK